MAAPKVAYVADYKDNHLSVEMPRNPPRLSVALLWATPGRFEGWQTDLDKAIVVAKAAGKSEEEASRPIDLDAQKSPEAFDKELGLLLTHIYQRLDKGLLDAWVSRYGYGAPEPPKQPGQTNQDRINAMYDAWLKAYPLQALWDEPEEQWARAFAEMFVYAPYGGAAMAILGSFADDKIYAVWPDFYSIVVACQHLSTYNVLTRGFSPSRFVGGRGLTAGPNDGQLLFKPPSDDRPLWLADSLEDYESKNLRPGDVAAGNQGADQNGFAHIASVLRRWPLGASAEGAPENAGRGAKYQWMDTGPLAGFGDNNTQDHSWIEGRVVHDRFSPAASDRRGVGKLPVAENLAAAAQKAREALPLGFARLVLLKPSGSVRYVSAMLPMWYGKKNPFPISRYIWSLRELPAKDLRAYWAIYCIGGERLLTEVTTDPQRTCDALFQAAAQRGGGGKPHLKLVAVFTSEREVFRDNTTKADVWKETTVHDDGEAMNYQQGAAADEARKREDAKKAKGRNYAPTAVAGTNPHSC